MDGCWFTQRCHLLPVSKWTKGFERCRRVIISRLHNTECHECHECHECQSKFRNGQKKFTYIYNKNDNYFYYIYTWAQKKANGKSSLTLMTLMTLMTLVTLPQKKLSYFFIFFFRHVKRKTHLRELNLLTYLTPKNADFLGSSFRAIFQKSSFLT